MTQIASLSSLLGNPGAGSSANSPEAADGSNFASVLSVAQAGAQTPRQAPASPDPQAPTPSQAQTASASRSPGAAANSDAQAQGSGASSTPSGGATTQGASAGSGSARQASSSSQAPDSAPQGPDAQSQASAATGSGKSDSPQPAGASGSAADARRAAADAAAGQAGAAAQAAAQAILAQWAALAGQGATAADGGKAGAQAGGKSLPPGTQVARAAQALSDGQALAKTVSDGGAQALRADARAEQAALGTDAHGAQARFEQVATQAVAAAAHAASPAPVAMPDLSSAGGGLDARAAATAGGAARANGAQAPGAALAALNAAGQLGTAIQAPASGVEAAATYSAALPSPVGSAPWGQELGQQMLMAVDGKLQTATLHLNPPQLGPLEVQLQMQGGQVNAQFASPHQAVRQAVESALPQLHDMFAGAGIHLGQASVGTGSPREGGHGGSRSRSATARGESALDAVPAGALAPSSPGWLRGLVNTYV